jgi:hypothetical protein
MWGCGADVGITCGDHVWGSCVGIVRVWRLCGLCVDCVEIACGDCGDCVGGCGDYGDCGCGVLWVGWRDIVNFCDVVML